MTLLESLHAALVAAGIENCYMLEAPDIDECVTIAPYMPEPFADVPIVDESFQLATRSRTYSVAWSRSWDAFRVLSAGNVITSLRGSEQYVLAVKPIQTPQYLGRDASGKRHLMIFNINVSAGWAEKGRI